MVMWNRPPKRGKKMQDLDKKSYPSENEIRKFWEGCGWHTEVATLEAGYQYYITLAPEESLIEGCSGYIPPHLPPIDLNNLFKYAMSKLLERYDIKIFSVWDDLNNKVFWFVQFLNRETGDADFSNIEGYEQLKDALFEVIEEVIKNDK